MNILLSVRTKHTIWNIVFFYTVLKFIPCQFGHPNHLPPQQAHISFFHVYKPLPEEIKSDDQYVWMDNFKDSFKINHLIRGYNPSNHFEDCRFPRARRPNNTNSFSMSNLIILFIMHDVDRSRFKIDKIKKKGSCKFCMFTLKSTPFKIFFPPNDLWMFLHSISRSDSSETSLESMLKFFNKGIELWGEAVQDNITVLVLLFSTQPELVFLPVKLSISLRLDGPAHGLSWRWNPREFVVGTTKLDIGRGCRILTIIHLQWSWRRI